jgi:uncharacterized SAM-binding protein YcdF (DUF218 family)
VLVRLTLSFAVISLSLLSLPLPLPVVSQSLFVWLEAPFVKQAASARQSMASAEVVLGGGRLRLAPEFDGKDQLSHHALWRLRYGAYLARKLVDTNGDQLPIIVSGSTVRSYETAMAAELLEQEFSIKRVLQESNSRDTWQNAIKTSELLEQMNSPTVLLVTYACHMRRAQYSFLRAGGDIIPMVTGFVSGRLVSEGEPWYGWWDDWLPSAYHLNQSYIALHEYIGLLFYLIR